MTLQGVSLGRFLAKFSQLNVVPSAGESDCSNKELFIPQVFHHFYASCPVCLCRGCSRGAGAALPPTWSLRAAGSSPQHAVHSPSAILSCWPEQASGHHPPFGLAIRFVLFIHPSARVIPRLGYMRTYVWCYSIEIGGTDGRLLPRRNTDPFIQDPNPGSRHSVLLPVREKCKVLMPEISVRNVPCFCFLPCRFPALVLAAE